MTLPSPSLVLANDALLSRIRESLTTQKRGGRLTTDSLRQTINIQLRAYYPEIAEKNDQESQIWTIDAYVLLEDQFTAEFGVSSALTSTDREIISTLMTDEEYSDLYLPKLGDRIAEAFRNAALKIGIPTGGLVIAIGLIVAAPFLASAFRGAATVTKTAKKALA